MRLDRILANSGIGSRSEVKNHIRKGRISLHGEILRSGKTQIKDEDRFALRFDNKPIQISKNLYFLMNKPAGLITSMELNDDDAIAKLLPELFFNKKVMPVGRLDKDTTGLLIFTNNGELNHRLLSPKYKIPRKYYVEVEILTHAFNEDDQKLVQAGIKLNERETASAAILEILSETECYLTLFEGKYHEVKRIMHALGKEVINLHRESYGKLQIHNEEPGELRKLESSEALDLLELCKLSATDL